MYLRYYNDGRSQFASVLPKLFVTFQLQLMEIKPIMVNVGSEHINSGQRH